MNKYFVSYQAYELIGDSPRIGNMVVDRRDPIYNENCLRELENFIKEKLGVVAVTLLCWRRFEDA